jgi:hypothetical protein
VRIEKLTRAFDIEPVLVHFPLHPETPVEGMALETLFAGRGVDLEAMYQRMKGLMDAEGLPYGRRSHTYNSRLAQELGKWADTVPGGGKLHDALYRAYFVDARNIGDPAVLLEIVGETGRAPLPRCRRRRLGEVAGLRRHRGAHLRRRPARRGRGAALRGAGAARRTGRRRAAQRGRGGRLSLVRRRRRRDDGRREAAPMSGRRDDGA